MGARVGILKSSGRAAESLLEDTQWAGHVNLLELPSDTMTLKALLNWTCDSELDEDTILEMAQQVHKQKVIADFSKWDDLAEDLKWSNVHQVKFIQKSLASEGYDIIRKEQEHTEPLQLPDPVILRLAEYEHGRWTIERLLNGWSYAPKKNPAKRLSPSLVAWDELPAAIKEMDIRPVQNWSQLLFKAGFVIQKIELGHGDE